MMNLLIALMTTTFDNIYKQARTESSFAIAEATFDLSHRSRFMPAPICIYVIALAVLIHVLNFIPALIWPSRLNIYNCINHDQYQGLVTWKLSTNGCGKICNFFCCRKNRGSQKKMENTCFVCCKCESAKTCTECKKCCNCCNRSRHSKSGSRGNIFAGIELKTKETDGDVYKLTTRGRVWKYYASTFFCCDICTPKCVEKKLSKHRFEIHHIGCYSCIPTELGAKDQDKDRSTCHGITLNEYADTYEQHHKFSLDPADTVLLKHLTVDTLFCKYCYRPFDPKNRYNLKDVLLTPFGH